MATKKDNQNETKPKVELQPKSSPKSSLQPSSKSSVQPSPQPITPKVRIPNEIIYPKDAPEQVFIKQGYLIGIKLNYGSFAQVFKAKKGIEDIAVKVIDLDKTSQDYRNKFLPRELNIVKILKHPNIVLIHDIFTCKNKVYIFMELAEGGDMLDALKANKGPLDEVKAKLWFKQICEAIRYMHGNGIAHRDLKSENVLISKTGNIKVTDFGFARVCIDQKGKRLLSETYCGSAAYVGPEVLKAKPYNPMLSDIWSLGVVLYVMVNNAIPFDDSDIRKMMVKQNARKWCFSSKVTKKLSPECKDLIVKMLEPELERRIIMSSIFEHPWLKDAASLPSNPSTTNQKSESLPAPKPKK